MTPLWGHQRLARDFVLDHWSRGYLGALLAMWMGTGKTRTAIELVSAADVDLVLILCPLAVVEVWRAQFQFYATSPFHFVALDDRAGSVAQKMCQARADLRWAQERKQRLAIAINYDSARLDPFAGWALKQVWPLVIYDECVPPGSLISTPNGGVPIEELREGDTVLGYNHATGSIVNTPVTATFARFTTSPLTAVRGALMTPNHLVWTANRGYTPAGNLRNFDEVLLVTKPKDLPWHLQTVPAAVYGREKDNPILQQELSLEMDLREARNAAPVGGEYALDFEAAGGAGKASTALGAGAESIPSSSEPGQGAFATSPDGLPHAQWRQWTGAHKATASPGSAAAVADRVGGSYLYEEGGGLPKSLQNRHCGTRPANRYRSGRLYPSISRGEGEGQQEGCLSGVPWLGCVALPESGNSGQPGYGGEPHPVHNLETGTGNYFVNSLLVHNCHRLKQASGRTSLFAAQLSLRAHRRLGLTGTPMPHEPTDIWGQFRALDRSILDPTYGSFRKRHAIMGGYYDKQVVGWRDLDQLYARFRQIAYQVPASVLDLPPEMDQILSADLGAEGTRVYREMEQEMITWLGELEEEATAANSLVRLGRLMQITGGSMPSDRRQMHVIDHAKENLLTELLTDTGPGEPVVVFALYREDLAAIHRAAKAADLESAELSGSADGLALWQKADGPTVLAVQIAAGSVGIDLTRARIGVYYSLGFSLEKYLQSRARILRPPQTRPVVYYHLQIRNSIDESVLRAVLAREDLVRTVLKELKKACRPQPLPT